jgi:hypothetical protein
MGQVSVLFTEVGEGSYLRGASLFIEARDLPPVHRHFITPPPLINISGPPRPNDINSDIPQGKIELSL